MKRKIKKYLFNVNEVCQLRNLLYSEDNECIKLGIAMFLNSKTYKHYIQPRVSPTLIDWIGIHNTHQLIKLIEDYSHFKYKK